MTYLRSDMPTVDFFNRYFQTINKKVGQIELDKLEQIAGLIEKADSMRKKIILVGNGGSAAIASHASVDFTKAAGIRATNFNEADLLTCLANDYGYEHWVEKALEFYADPNDLVILISSSGRSPNILNGANQATRMGLVLITLSGFSAQNPLCNQGDVNLWVDSVDYNTIEITHLTWLLAVIDFLIEKKRAPSL